MCTVALISLGPILYCIILWWVVIVIAIIVSPHRTTKC